MKSTSDIAHDFDTIAASLAAAPPRAWLTSSERWLLDRVPPKADTALDVGCGDGTLCRVLAGKGLVVRGIDISPQMIALARAHAGESRKMEFEVADIVSDHGFGTFDVVTSVNMVHHLPVEVAVPRLAAVVAPGGVLLIQDVLTREGLRYLALNVAGALAQRARRLLSAGRGTRKAAHATALAYQEHGVGETYLKPTEVDATYRSLLPGAHIEQHLEWRYSVVWNRPTIG